MGEQIIEIEQDRRMEKVVINYLDMETSYALLMNGPRGIGKTFFIKETIQPLIKTTHVKHDQSKMYIPVYISLYGIKTIDEIYTILAIELIPFLKNKNVKVGLAVTKLITRGVLNFKGGGDIDHYLKDITDTKKTLVDTKDFVLLFDDLDRISESLEVGEVIGFINSLVEHENNKIIIIGDDEQLKNDPKYVAVKEKTIGTVIEYIATISDNYNAIINLKYKSSYGIYYEYLLKEKEDILHWFNVTGTKSLRTLIYFFQHFHSIFSSLYVELNLQKEDEEGFAYKKLKVALRFALAITIEFKKGQLSYQTTNGIDNMREINLHISKQTLKDAFGDNMRSLQNNTSEPPSKSYRETFIARYFNGDYEFYASIFNFITGGDAFDIKLLLWELKTNFDDRIFKPKPQDVVFQKLSDPVVYDLSNEEYGKLTDQMLAYANKGAYPLDRYIAILLYTQRFPEIKKYLVSEQAYQLIDNIKTNAKKFSYDDDLRSKFDVNHRYKDDKEFQDLWKALNEVNNSIKQSQIEQNRADLFIEFQNDPDQFYLKAKEIPDIPILAHWDFEKFYKYFINMPASEIPRFRRFIKKRYEFLIREKLEFFFISNLFDEIQKVNLTEKKTLKRIALDKLGEVLKEIIDRNYALKIFTEQDG